MRTLEWSSSPWPVKKISGFRFRFHTLLLVAPGNASAPRTHLFSLRSLKEELEVRRILSPQISEWLFTLGTFPPPSTRWLGWRTQGPSSCRTCHLFTHTCLAAPGRWEVPGGRPSHLCFQFLPGHTGSQKVSCRISWSPGIPAAALEQWGTALPKTSSIPGLRDKAQGSRDGNLQ